MAPSITKEVKGGPTAEAPTTGTQASRRGIIPGFPPPSSPLPKDIDHEAIIKHYPNHLRGKLLLEIAATWTPKEISATNGRPELKANTIVKRIKVAKMAEGHHHHQNTTRKKSAKRAATTTAAQELAPPPPAPQATPESTESQASLSFLEEQSALQKIMMELDPEWADRQIGLRKKLPLRDRMLVRRAVAEYERRTMGVGVAAEVAVVVDDD